jgi:hypothetical protein
MKNSDLPIKNGDFLTPGFWWTKHPHRYLNVGQIIPGRDLRHVKIAET